MPNRRFPVRPEMPVSTDPMIADTIVWPVSPVVLLVPDSIALTPPPVQGSVEAFVYFGWTMGLVALVPALIGGHFPNRSDLDCWLATVSGALVGCVIGLAIAGIGGMMVAATRPGAVYASHFWAIPHGLATLNERRSIP